MELDTGQSYETEKAGLNTVLYGSVELRPMGNNRQNNFSAGFKHIPVASAILRLGYKRIQSFFSSKMLLYVCPYFYRSSLKRNQIANMALYEYQLITVKFEEVGPSLGVYVIVRVQNSTRTLCAHHSLRESTQTSHPLKWEKTLTT
jgi:hypothetical protein